MDLENSSYINSVSCLLSNGLLDLEKLRQNDCLTFNPTDYRSASSKFVESILKQLLNGTKESNLVKLENNDRYFKNLWGDFRQELQLNDLNSQQLCAIKKSMDISQNILCIQGAAGTGKTEIIAIIALINAYSNKKVLIAAATNEAADNLVQRILSLYPEASNFLIRPCSQTYSIEDTNQVYCLNTGILDNDSNILIVITTLGMANNSKSLFWFNPNCLIVEEASLVLHGNV